MPPAAASHRASQFTLAQLFACVFWAASGLAVIKAVLMLCVEPTGRAQADALGYHFGTIATQWGLGPNAGLNLLHCVLAFVVIVAPGICLGMAVGAIRGERARWSLLCVLGFAVAGLMTFITALTLWP